MAKEYRLHNNELDAMQHSKTEFNRELDATINMLRAIDDIEVGLAQAEVNGARIMDLLTKVCNKTLIQKGKLCRRSRPAKNHELYVFMHPNGRTITTFGIHNLYS